jgi:hypothetical protein
VIWWPWFAFQTLCMGCVLYYMLRVCAMHSRSLAREAAMGKMVDVLIAQLDAARRELERLKKEIEGLKP